MTLAELTLYATLLLGVLSTASGRIAYVDDVPQVQQGSQAYNHPSFSMMQQEKDRRYDTETEEYDMYAIDQQERCLGEQKQITRFPFVKGDICSVTQNQCGWVKFNVKKYYFYRVKPFLRYYPDARGQLNAEFRVCQSKFPSLIA